MILRLKKVKFLFYPVTGLADREFDRLPGLRRTLE